MINIIISLLLNPGWWCTWAQWWRGRWSAPRGSVPQSLSQGLRIYFWCQCVGMCLCMFIMKVGNFLHVSHKKWALCICLSVCDTLTVCCHLLYLSLIQISYSAQSRWLTNPKSWIKINSAVCPPETYHPKLHPPISNNIQSQLRAKGANQDVENTPKRTRSTMMVIIMRNLRIVMTVTIFHCNVTTLRVLLFKRRLQETSTS